MMLLAKTIVSLALPSELKHFKEYTLGKILVCGKNTFLSLPSLLKNRKTIILSKMKILYLMSKKVDLFKSKFPLEEVPFYWHYRFCI